MTKGELLDFIYEFEDMTDEIIVDQKEKSIIIRTLTEVAKRVALVDKL